MMRLTIALALVVLLPLVSAQTQCSSASTCQQCTSLPSCGYCADYPIGGNAAVRGNMCMPGGISGPSNGIHRSLCLGGWAWVRSACSAITPTTPAGTGPVGPIGTGQPVDCTSLTSCTACARASGCGFCSGVNYAGTLVNTCFAGTSSGPSNGIAASSCTRGWQFTRAACAATGPTTPTPGTVVAPVNCQDYTTCDSCARQPQCAYCSQVLFGPSLVNTCLPANFFQGSSAGGLGPSACAGGFHATANTCPSGSPTTPSGTAGTGMTGMTGSNDGTPNCSALNCRGCTAVRGCGWCPGFLYGSSLISACLPGNAFKPTSIAAAACQLGYRYGANSCSA